MRIFERYCCCQSKPYLGANSIRNWAETEYLKATELVREMLTRSVSRSRSGRVSLRGAVQPSTPGCTWSKLPIGQRRREFAVPGQPYGKLYLYPLLLCPRTDPFTVGMRYGS
jgi:hypothetical protein